ncbi:peptide chain release factor N(5)-glutamine methyltransferase [Candidatus Saccharibacteria bacterium]|nr:peptide chain release factor N(5)-glutamine methyltransferase [Candidatus Saccharibacteria bacterium]NCU40258.1 peptide chain release factor N(5)-glutamine methyltransferase [Candidatus Saccharibacteria bacterium]
MESISKILHHAKNKFVALGIETAQLDAEVLLAHALDVRREWLAAHPEQILLGNSLKIYMSMVKRRINREPVAYIIGKKEFYGRDFIVTPEVLIPRPDTEDLIDLCLKYSKETADIQNPYLEKLEKGEPFTDENSTDCRIVDVGTGSGCVGITLKLEIPEATVVLTDISTAALAIARKNAENLDADVMIVESDLLDKYSKTQNAKSKIHFDLIVANLPYVDKSWEVSPETIYEPQLALFAEDDGLVLIKKLICQSKYLLKPGGILALEADPEQHSSIAKYANQYRLKQVDNKGYALVFELE